MSMQPSTFLNLPGGKQEQKSPLNVLVKLFKPTYNDNISANNHYMFFALLYTKVVLKLS